MFLKGDRVTQNFSTRLFALELEIILMEPSTSFIYRQSPVKNQPINHKVDNFYVLTKSSPQHERNLNKSKSSQFIPRENEVAM